MKNEPLVTCWDRKEQLRYIVKDWAKKHPVWVRPVVKRVKPEESNHEIS